MSRSQGLPPSRRAVASLPRRSASRSIPAASLGCCNTSPAGAIYIAATFSAAQATVRVQWNDRRGSELSHGLVVPKVDRLSPVTHPSLRIRQSGSYEGGTESKRITRMHLLL